MTNSRVSDSFWLLSLTERFAFCPTRTGARNPAWSKSRVPVDWPLTWTNRPATGRAKSPTVTSSRVSRCIDQVEPTYLSPFPVCLFLGECVYNRSGFEKCLVSTIVIYASFSHRLIFYIIEEQKSRDRSVKRTSLGKNTILRRFFFPPSIKDDEKCFIRYGEGRFLRRLAT